MRRDFRKPIPAEVVDLIVKRKDEESSTNEFMAFLFGVLLTATIALY